MDGSACFYNKLLSEDDQRRLFVIEKYRHVRKNLAYTVEVFVNRIMQEHLFEGKEPGDIVLTIESESGRKESTRFSDKEAMAKDT